VVGQTDNASVTALIGTLHGLGALILISSDLSHYLDYEQARELDATTSAAITALDCHLQPQQACGSKAINGMNGFARAQGWRAQLLAQCNSGDSAGDKSRVVGYGAYAYC
jgi:hypothetical protein